MYAPQPDPGFRPWFIDKLQCSIAFGGAFPDHHLCFFRLRRGDDRNVWLDDSGFFARDFRNRITKPFLMVKVDRRDDRDRRRHGIGRIQASAHPGLEDENFASRLVEMSQGKRSRNFKKCRMRIPGRNQIANLSQPTSDLFFGDHFAIDLDTLAKADKVRGGEKAGEMASGTTDRLCHGTNRAFPVRTGDVDDLRWKTQLQFTQQTLDVLETKFDPVALGRVKPRQGFAIVHAGGAKNWRNCAICGRNLLRSTIWSINPCSFRNSAVWNPFGRSWCVVSLITRGPAKPIMLFGSARMA